MIGLAPAVRLPSSEYTVSPQISQIKYREVKNRESGFQIFKQNKISDITFVRIGSGLGVWAPLLVVLK